MPRISALVHTLNEENSIRACLETLKWVDEIVVVDMYSDDKTVEICHEYTDKIYFHERTGFVEPARKFGLEKTTGDWILVVDADERIPYPLSRILSQTAAENELDVVEIATKNFIFGKWIRNTGFFPDYHPRFFRRGSITTSNDVHTRFETTGRKTYLDPDMYHIVHFGYTDTTEFIEKMNRYTSFEVRKFIRQDKAFSVSRMLKSGFYEFRRRYVSKRGYRDGVHGLVISMFRAFYNSLIYIKYWEHLNSHQISVEQKYKKVERELLAEYQDK